LAWSLVQTAPHAERHVSRMLRAYGIVHHLFQELKQHVWRGKVIERAHPLFPGYLFVRTALWDLVRSICGVLGFVKAGERIAHVDDHVIDTLVKAAVNDVLPVRAAPVVSRFGAGDRVRIVGTSLFAGHLGRFQRMLTMRLASIEIDLFGRWISVPVDDRDLERDIPRRRRRRRREGRRSASAVVAAA
jgi:transcription antitermination factor NusG